MLNRELRKNAAGCRSVRGRSAKSWNFGNSRAFAVCDHQLAHVYVQDEADRRTRARGLPRRPAGRRPRLDGRGARARSAWIIPRSGELVALAEPDAWFAYPFWLDDALAPDYARTVDIHRKPGYDPCELFLDPKIAWPTGRVASRLLRKKLGFRTLFDVIPLDASLVRGSHGLAASNDEDRPLLAGDGAPPNGGGSIAMTEARDLILNALFPGRGQPLEPSRLRR